MPNSDPPELAIDYSVDPASLSDEQYRALMDAAASDTPGMEMRDPASLSDEQYRALMDSAADPTGAQAQQSTLTGPGSLIDYWGKKLQLGGESTVQGLLYNDVLEGRRTLESVRDSADAERLKLLQTETGNYDKALSDWDPRKWVGGVLESAPFMGLAATGGAIGAAGGAAAGGGAALAAGQLGPQAGLPEELVSVPAAAAFGARWGGRYGAFRASSMVMAGGAYKEFLDAGIDPDRAKQGAVVAGTVSGLVEVLELGQLTAIGRKALLEELKTAEGKQAVTTWVAGYLKETGIQIAEEEVQDVSTYVIGILEEYNSKHGNEVYTWDGIFKQAVDTFVQAAGPSALMVGTAKGAGAIAGKATNATLEGIASVVKTRDQMQQAINTAESVMTGKEVLLNLTGRVAQGKATISDVFNLIKEGMGRQPTQEEVQAVSSQDVDTVLDALQQQLFDEEGNVKPEALKSITDEQIAQAQTDRTTLTAGIQQTEEAPPDIPPPIQDQPLESAPSLETQGRITQVRSEIAALDKDISAAEKQFTKLDTGNTKAVKLKQEIADLENQQKANAAQIRKLNTDLYAKQRAGKDTANIGKTLDKIGAKQEAVVDQLARRKAELEKLTTGATDAIVTKLDKLYERRAEMEGDIEMLKNGLYTAEDLGRKSVKVRADQITALRTKAAKETISAFKKGVREGQVFTLDEVRTAQSQLISVLKTSGLDPKDKAKFITTLRNIQNQQQFRKALPEIERRIDDLLEAGARRDAIKRFNDLLDQSKLKKSKYPEGKFTADVQRILNTYREFTQSEAERRSAFAQFQRAVKEGAPKSTVDALNEKYLAPTKGELATAAFEEALTAGTATPEVILANKIAQDIRMEGKSAKQIEAAIADLEQIMATGRAGAVDRMLAWQEELDAVIPASLASIQGNKPFSEKERGKSMKNDLSKIKRVFGAEAETWKGMMDLVSQHDDTHAISKLLDANAAREQYFKMTDEWQQKISDRAKAAAKTMNRKFGTSFVKSLGRKLALDEEVNSRGLGEYVDFNDGEVKTLYRSVAEARKMWMEFQAAKVDPVIKESFRQGNGFTFKEDIPAGVNALSTEQLIEDVLAPEDIALAEMQFEVYDELFDEVLNPFWRDIFGADLPKTAFYSPLQREDFTVSDDTTLLNHFVQTGGIRPSSTIKRTDSTLPIAPQSDFQALARHVDQILRFVNYHKFDRISKAVFNDGKIRREIKNKYGDTVYRLIATHRSDITLGHAMFMDSAFKWLSGLRGKIATGQVAGNVSALLKQPTAMFTALRDVGPIDFAKSALKTFANPIGTYKMLAQSATFRRLLKASDRDTIELLNAQKLKDPTQGEGVLGFTLLPLRFGVGIGSTISGRAVYDKAIKGGASIDEALTQMNDFLTDTQQAGFVENQSAMERQNELARLLTQYGGDPLQSARQIIRANRDFLSNPSPQKFLQAVKTYMVFHLTVPLAFQIASIFTDSDDEGEHDAEKLLRAVIFGPWGQIPVVGDTLNYATIQLVNRLTGNDEYGFEPTLPILSVIKAAAKGLPEMAQSLNENDFEQFITAMHDLAKGSPLLPEKAGGGLPWYSFVRFMLPKEEKARYTEKVESEGDK